MRAHLDQARAPLMFLRALLLAFLVALPAWAGTAPTAEQFRRASGPLPTYPTQALKEGIQGVVELKVTTDAQSRVIQVVVLDETPAGNEFGRHAVDVMKYWTFEPAAAGKTFSYRMTFRLR
ncbi:MAG: Gram-negative bacterial TonB protein C-terminal [Rhodospirillales bacterium]|nr:Gram-negative bacterial TonB protein C-terminal [Rhodospirillales bacterium]